MTIMTIKEAADELRVSRRWLEYWLAANPVDAAGIPFYVPMGRSKKFERSDIDRILSHMRAMEGARIGPGAASKARLVVAMSNVGGGYNELLKLRASQSSNSVSTKLLGRMAVESVLGPSKVRKKLSPRRVRLPRRKPQDES
jgi:excisionase family DNA binding protein